VTISSQQQELVDLLRNELADMANSDLSALRSEDFSERLLLLEEQEAQAENIGNAARLVGLGGAAAACDWLSQNFRALAEDAAPPGAETCECVASWPGALLKYLESIGDDNHEPQSIGQFLQFLKNPAWPLRLTEEQAAAMAAEFTTSTILLDEAPVLYPERVTEEMVSLAPGEDINPELLRGLLAELPTQVSAFDRAVEQYLIMEEEVQLRVAQRIAHTLKGAANVVGIQGIANLTHYVEDLLELSAKHKRKEPKLGFLLQDVADCLSSISEYLVGLAPPPDNVHAVMTALLDMLRGFVDGGPSSPAGNSFTLDSESQTIVDEVPDSDVLAPADELTAGASALGELADGASALESDLDFEADAIAELDGFSEVDSLLEESGADVQANVTASAEIPVLEDIYHRPGGAETSGKISAAPAKPAAVLKVAQSVPSAPAEAPAAEAAAPVEGETTLNITESQAQELLRLSGESQIGNTQILSRLDLVSGGIKAAEAYHGQLRQLAQDLERLLELQNARVAATGVAHEQEMDPLELERLNELNSFASQLHELTTDAHEAFIDLETELKSLKNLVLGQRQLGFESQELLLSIRMLPVNLFSSRFSRCVRQAARLTHKTAELEIKGEDVLVDSRVLATLVDPIMHLLRNAVDHGLEGSEAERAAQGKPATGHITLEFQRAGDTVVVHCRDDGRGLDYEAINRVAVERGLAPTDSRLTIADLNALILSPGFSTRREVTQTSGRGVGLDVVNEQIRLLKGTLSVSSQRGRGTTFTLAAPMSIMSAHTLVVQVGEYRLSVVSRALEQVVYVEQRNLTVRDGRQWYQLPGEEEPLPVFNMDDLLYLSTRPAERYAALMVLRNREGRRCGVLAESIKASEEQIIKPLSRSTYKVPGVVGATILGDGRVSPVVDLYDVPGLSLADAAQAAWRQRLERRLSHLQSEMVRERPMALVVDDSLSARRSLAQFVGDMGMEVYTAKDGFEAIQIIEQRLPSIILVDLEMPRMNGLELTSHLRAKDETRDIPIIMITSRATEKHRSMASRVGVNTYLNKPWTDEELLSSIQSQIA
jgi:chemotaxis protein histidine kinase CheA/ActR/RegA family two-component response regulator